MMSHGNRANDGKDLLPFCTRDFDSAVFQLMSQDTSRSVRPFHASGSCSIQTEIFNFLLITYFRHHVTEYVYTVL